MKISYYNSLIGILEIVSLNDELLSLKLVNEAKASFFDDDFTNKIIKQLDEYFIGKRRTFSIKINPKGTEFQKKVWMELVKIPYGKTNNYSEIAQSIGNTNAQRAVGNACNKNPIPIIIPCHRVIPKSGKSGGYAYGNSVKQKLLNIEKQISI